MKEKENEGLKLLKKGQKGIVQAFFGRTGLIVVLLLLDFGLLFSVFTWFSELLPHFYGGTVLFSVCVVIYLLNTHMDGFYGKNNLADIDYTDSDIWGFAFVIY